MIIAVHKTGMISAKISIFPKVTYFILGTCKPLKEQIWKYWMSESSQMHRILYIF
jgi:hypothetical protein